MQKTVYSDEVTFYLAHSRDEAEALAADMPRAIRGGLAESLDSEGVVLRYGARNRCAFHVTRHGPGLAVWTWCDLGPRRRRNYSRQSSSSLARKPRHLRLSWRGAQLRAR